MSIVPPCSEAPYSHLSPVMRNVSGMCIAECVCACVRACMCVCAYVRACVHVYMCLCMHQQETAYSGLVNAAILVAVTN